MQLKLNRYSPVEKKRWNSLIDSSINGTFLFNRNYMEYHSDRFIDHSITIYNNIDLVAVIPATVKGDTFISHGGLTYGGLIHDHRINTKNTLEIFDLLLTYLSKIGINKIIYKTIPHIYHIKPCEEDLYALFRYNFELFRRDPSSTINLQNSSVPGKKLNRFKKLSNEGIKIVDTKDSSQLIDVIKKNLIKQYGVSPVHTSDELNLLKSRFPKNIIFYEAYINNMFLGGTILYLTKNVVHVQYMAATEIGYELRLFDYLFTCLTDFYKNAFHWFDFGISSENDGKYLNTGLIAQKEGFNASTVCYDFYRISI
ncbi:MAG TPA: hypothetical protein PL041_11460 [Melioribacteraceae bacterium]|nr:hypothetical protein [Melioribacteraceae bacterium]